MGLRYLNRVMRISNTILLVLRLRDNHSGDSYYSWAIQTVVVQVHCSIIIIVAAAAYFISKRQLNLPSLDHRLLVMHLFQTTAALSHSCVGSAHGGCIQ